MPGLGGDFVVLGSEEGVFAVGGEVELFFSCEDVIDNGAAEEGRAALGDGGVFLAGGAGVRGLDGFLRGGSGVGVAVEVVLLLDCVTGDGFGALLNGLIDALDDLLFGELGGRLSRL